MSRAITARFNSPRNLSPELANALQPDIMFDPFTKRKRSEIMSRVRGTKNETTEVRLIEVFRAQDIAGWRRGSKLPGKPDFVFPKLKTAVFVDGCFWHGCPNHGRKPLGNAPYWLAKLTGNKARDRRVNRALRERGWTVVRIWEHELKRKGEAKLVRRLHKLLRA
jgi:DNA mismatch endonuclease (patch repair protein)